jgi:hypothetical protein
MINPKIRKEIEVPRPMGLRPGIKFAIIEKFKIQSNK